VGRPEVSGAAVPESKIVHAGKQASRLKWDFSKCPDGNMSFANFTFGRELVGYPQAVKVWVYAEAPAKGTRLALWIVDASGETYISRHEISHTGWKEISIPVASSPGWTSGDKNSKLDPPTSLFGLAVDYGGPAKGWIVIDDLRIVTLATPRQALLATLGSDRPDSISWEDQPVVVGTVRNVSSLPVSDLVFDFTVKDVYYGRDVQQGRIAIAKVDAKSTSRGEVTLKVPYGLHAIEWTLSDKDGVIRKSGSEVARMLPKCYQGLSQVEKEYLTHECPFGGVFWQCSAEKGSDTGARWIRNWTPAWNLAESKPGVYDFAATRKRVKEFADVGIESLWLTTLYEKPEFYEQTKADYAPAYGAYHRELAKSLTGMVDMFECGNEDNGPTKFLYTEVGRHGASGVHAANPLASVANSGTAFCDVGWLKMQATRGLFDWMDVLCTHPYTTSDSPEKWGVFEQTRQVVELADELGGMKRLWTTEFGWPVEVDEKNHTDWVVRHFLIGVAGGYEKHGLYAWDGHFGIYSEGRPLLAAVSTHTMCKLLEGYRFAGILENTNDVWAVVWEKFGGPIVIAWSPSGNGSLRDLQVDLPGRIKSLNTGPSKVEVRDVLGNPIPVRLRDGKLSMKLSTGPIYILHGSRAITAKAQYNQLEELYSRLEAHRQKMQTKGGKLLADRSPDAAIEALGRVSTDYPNASRREIRGLQANLLRIIVAHARMGAVTVKDIVDVDKFVSQAVAAMQAAHADDLDMPDLRWVVDEVRSLDLERKFAESENQEAFAAALHVAQTVLARFAEANLMKPDTASFTAVWPYLYTLDTDGKTLRERLAFVPGAPRTVNVRVNSYARKAYEGELSLQLPTGWTCDPVSQTVKIPAGKDVETQCKITAGTTPMTTPKILAQLKISGKPVVTVPFDDIEIVPVIRVTQEPLSGLLPGTPLVLRLKNQDNKPQSGKVRLVQDKGKAAIAEGDFSNLSPNGEVTIKMNLSPGVAIPEFNEWPMVAEITLADGKVTREAFIADFACAVHADKAPVIDGDLSDWKDAAPLHVNKAEYAKGSYGLSWSPEDCGGTVYLKWDATNVYFAARVSDQTFNQNLHGQSIWSQDSIQMSFARDVKSRGTEIGLALTPQGEEIFRFTSDSDLPGGKLKVKVSQGEIVYEAAIPWSEVVGEGPVSEGMVLRFAILFNDDDAVIPRRFVERYGGIAHDKNVANFGYVHLLGGGKG